MKWRVRIIPAFPANVETWIECKTKKAARLEAALWRANSSKSEIYIERRERGSWVQAEEVL